MTVLIVDDEESIRRLLRRVLERQHAVGEAATVDEARRKLGAEHFELVLCDISMAGESGLELVRGIAGDAPETVVVMVTGVDDPHIAAEAVDLGVYGYLVKPFTTNEILIAVGGGAAPTRTRTRAVIVRGARARAAHPCRPRAHRPRSPRQRHPTAVRSRHDPPGREAADPGRSGARADRASIDEIDATIRTIRTVIFKVESKDVEPARLDARPGARDQRDARLQAQRHVQRCSRHVVGGKLPINCSRPCVSRCRTSSATHRRTGWRSNSSSIATSR